MPCLLLVASLQSLWLTLPRVLLALVVRGSRRTLSCFMRLHKHFLNVSRRSTSQWILGNARALPRKAGRLTYNSRSCLFKGIFNYAQAMRLLSHYLGKLLRIVPPRCQGRASRPVSIFARAPVCQESCTYCKACPCDVADEHDDHTCYECEQRRLNPGRDPNAPWRAPQLPACELTCDHCSRQKCCLRYLHDIHACYWCDRRPRSVPAPTGGGD